MKKGFTLIELLAVIVILAIIALIATPIVLNIINDTKESAILRSAEYYLDGVETSVASSILNNKYVRDGKYPIMQDGNLCIGTLTDNICSGEALKVEVKGEKPTSGDIRFSSGEITWIELELSNKEIMLNPNTQKLEYKLESGIYAKDDKLLISWNELIEKELIAIDFLTTVTSPPGICLGLGGVELKDPYKLVIDDSIKIINGSAFESCKMFKSIVIPSSVETIGAYAFADAGLEEVIISDGVKEIQDDAFWINNLTNIVIPSSITSIGNGAFSANQLSDSEAFIYARNADGSIDKTKIVSYGGSRRDNVVIPDGVVTINGFSFGAKNITSITIPSSVTSIGENAFSDNTLTSVKIKGKSSTNDFISYPDTSPFGWAAGYSDANIIWQS